MMITMIPSKFTGMTTYRLTGSLTFLAALSVGANALAAVNDVLPADYFPLAVGSTTVAAYAYDRKSQGFYSHGKEIAKDTLTTQIVALRVGKFVEVAGKPTSLIAVLPWAQADVGSGVMASQLGKSADGAGDIRLGATTWLIANRDSGQYLGLTAMASIPSGDYQRKQVLNIGENRYKTTLSLGVIQPLSRSIYLEVSPEIAWYGQNNEYLVNRTLDQKTSYALTSYLRYRTSPSWSFHLGWQENRGGQTVVNGVDQHDAAESSRLMAGTTFQSEDKKHQWVLRLSRETKVENGFKLGSEALVRYLYMP